MHITMQCIRKHADTVFYGCLRATAVFLAYTGFETSMVMMGLGDELIVRLGHDMAQQQPGTSGIDFQLCFEPNSKDRLQH